jgi:hypothetical protein
MIKYSDRLEVDAFILNGEFDIDGWLDYLLALIDIQEFYEWEQSFQEIIF